MPGPVAATLCEDFVPHAVHALLDRLERAGFATALVGGCVRDALLGRDVREFDVVTAAAPVDVLRLFPRAIPTGLRHGTVTVPTSDGPVDVTSQRAGPRLEDDLAHRDFTVNAIAWRHGVLVDPFHGREDLRADRLRAVGDATARLAEDPLRALRAVRLASVLGLAPDDALRAAVAGAARAIARIARERVRQELDRLLLGAHVARALEWLRASGLEASIVAGVREDAASVVAALPAEPSLRWAAWLRGTRARDVLVGLRSSHRRVDEVTRLLRVHPLDRDASPESEASVRRLLLRAGDALDPALALRRAELRAETPGDPAARERVERLAAAIERARARGAIASRAGLALDGEGVMRALGCAPGPHVGAALRWLEDRVVEDPARNTADGLRALLDSWPEAGRARELAGPRPTLG